MVHAKSFVCLVLVVCLFAVATRCEAHSLWLKAPVVEGQRQAYMFFGEDPSDEQYHMPEKIAKTEVWRRTADDQRAKLEMKPIGEGEGRVGLVSALADGEPCVLEANAVYGNYHGMLLTYWAKHIHAKSAASFNRAESANEFKLEVIPSVHADELRLSVFWDSKPLPEAAVNVAVGKGKSVELKTDKNGKVALRPEGEGLVSVSVSRTDAAAKGEHGGQPYTSTMDVFTLTFDWKKPEVFAKLPEPLASFGAAVSDGWLYIYGGHIGEQHAHSAANLSQHFRRMRLDGSGGWEELPMQTRLQGTALVAHRGKVYRIGGLNAKNATTEADEDMHSTDEFASFDPATKRWTALPRLPGPRSSHDAVVIGDKLYVVGGWALKGDSPGDWQKELLVYDLAKNAQGQGAWETLPPMGSSRRAVAAGEWQGKLVVLGGIDEDGAIQRAATFFDPKTGKWSDGPELPEGDMAGFGASAWNLDGRLYMSSLPDELYRLSEDGSKWEKAAELKVPRFFHRLLPASQANSILAVGGSAMDGHVSEIEVLKVR